MALTVNLPSDLEEKLTAEAAKQGITVSEYLRKIVEDLFAQSTEPEEPAFVHPLVRLAEEVWADIPEEERSRTPTDHARNYKHYLYGHPKVDE